MLIRKREGCLFLPRSLINMSKKGHSGRNITVPYWVKIPGFFIKASIDVPKYHPHSIWHFAYLAKIMKGTSLSRLFEYPPWPTPPDITISHQIVHELIDLGLISINWQNGNVRVKQNLKLLFDHQGEEGLTRQILNYETIDGEWWIDAIGGTLLSRQKALQFDFDFSKNYPGKIYESKAVFEIRELLDTLNVDVISLLYSIGRPELSEGVRGQQAFLSSPFECTGLKHIIFRMHQSYQHPDTRIIPAELNMLEPVLTRYAPEIFGKRHKRHSRHFKWSSSIIERFARLLENIPYIGTQMTDNTYHKFTVSQLREFVQQAEEWENWYVNGVYAEALAGYSNQHFATLGEFCRGDNWHHQFSIMKRSPKFIIIASSFLNIDNLYPDIGLIPVLQEDSMDTKILIIYGHANDDSPEEQNEDINAYLKKIFEYAPGLKDRLILIPASMRSHEKIILTSTGDWMIGSWNACSSIPGGSLFETSVKGHQREFCINLIEHISEQVDNPKARDWLTECQLLLSQEGKKQEKEEFINKFEYLKESVELFATIASSDRNQIDQNSYEHALNYLRQSLWPFITKAQIKLINEHQSRDVFINQLRSARQDIVIASDRITDSALDHVVLNDMAGKTIEGTKSIRILWGREWERQKKIGKEAREQIKKAQQALNAAQNILRDQLSTSFNPMENHAKFLLIDGCRGLITSENLLSYGGEKDKYESRELGIFIESPPVIRHIEGAALFHQLDYLMGNINFSKMTYRPYEWIVEGINQYYALDEIKHELDFDIGEPAIIHQAIVEELESQIKDNDLELFDQNLPRKRLSLLYDRMSKLKVNYSRYLVEAGEQYYLLQPSLDKMWRPYFEPIVDEFQISEQLDKIRQEISDKQEDISPMSVLIPNKTEDLVSELITQIMNDMVLIKKGSFIMGDKRVWDERPTHKVIISRDFYLGRYPVTQKIWEAVIGKIPPIETKNRHPEFPIIWVSYYDILEFLQKLNSLPASGGFDLPSEAEWEYACRAGSTGEYCFGNKPGFSNRQGKLEEYAWTKRNADRKIHPVGQLKPNAWGLYDMHGLVYENVKDGKRRFTSKTVTDPFGPFDRDSIGARGGGWGSFPFRGSDLRQHHFRCSCRTDNTKEEKSHRLGFRLKRMKYS